MKSTDLHRTTMNSSHQLPRFSNTSALANTAGNSEVLTAAAAVVSGVLAKTALGKSAPDFALVVTTRQRLVGIQDGISGRDEVRVAGLAVKG